MNVASNKYMMNLVKYPVKMAYLPRRILFRKMEVLINNGYTVGMG